MGSELRAKANGMRTGRMVWPRLLEWVLLLFEEDGNDMYIRVYPNEQMQIVEKLRPSGSSSIIVGHN